ncbi:lipopolysaccharide-induced tumor necrosis factor-alpha factor homolog isoform X2 [Brienomyrus brachyistius]|uniref:lipopolysaccharide-induced tumor necrosis factor-alpha factor homolog isoform X2 n=1 Tax=Brienomyrus brachyistius TaxID=42636 RepID=UPI0020B31AED|nr:lipopolysaccharide-induced tumor necrosis factor-alpha factor homolog isoform X2 [Brienomyrus brachyistius]
MPNLEDNIEAELGRLVVRQQQLRDRHNLLVMLEDFRSNGPLKRKGSDANKNSELEKIKQEMKELEEKEEQLRRQGNKTRKEEDIQNVINMGGVPVLPASIDAIIAAPPPGPAPQIILDVDNLPPAPSNTMCPSCHQYIITETVTRVGSTAWLVCIMSAMVGCVLGCCLLPFCTNCFKDIVHKCPKCRSQIHVCKKL